MQPRAPRLLEDIRRAADFVRVETQGLTLQEWRVEWKAADGRALEEIQKVEAISSFTNSDCRVAAVCILNIS